MKIRPMDKLVNTCIRYANSIHINKTPPNVLLNYILEKIERIKKLNDDSYPIGHKDKCISTCWECYETVLHRIKSSDDESWNDAVSDGKGHWRPRINIKYYGDDFEEYIMNIPDENQTLT